MLCFKINNTWVSFHNDVTKIKETLKHTSFPPFLIDKITKSYLDKVHSNSDQSNPVKTRFYKLPYVKNIQSKFRKSCQKSVNSSAKMLILIFFLLLKLKLFLNIRWNTLFLKSFLVYKFVCGRGNSCYIGETCCQFKTRIDEYVKHLMKRVSQVLIQIVFLFSLRCNAVSR